MGSGSHCVKSHRTATALYYVDVDGGRTGGHTFVTSDVFALNE